MNRLFLAGVLIVSAPIVFSLPQQKRAFTQQSPATITYRNDKSSEVLEIRNITYELTGSGISGRPQDERLVLRTTTQSKQVLDEVGVAATTTVEAWPLGGDLTQKPLYSVRVPGVSAKTVNSAVLVVSRGLDEFDWWSVYKIGSGEHLFDTYVPMAAASISRDTLTLRYVGLQVPPDDIEDRRLQAPNVVGVLTYASSERVVREALVTADDPKTARLLRSFADSNRALTFDGNRIRISIDQNYPLPSKAIAIEIPVTRDDLDIARIQSPAGLHLAVWKR